VFLNASSAWFRFARCRKKLLLKELAALASLGDREGTGKLSELVDITVGKFRGAHWVRVSRGKRQ